jgi:hypothetical protein
VPSFSNNFEMALQRFATSDLNLLFHGLYYCACLEAHTILHIGIMNKACLSARRTMGQNIEK